MLLFLYLFKKSQVLNFAMICFLKKIIVAFSAYFIFAQGFNKITVLELLRLLGKGFFINVFFCLMINCIRYYSKSVEYKPKKLSLDLTLIG